MMCPYCGEAMEWGCIPSLLRSIIWYPQGEKSGMESSSPNSVPIAQWEFSGNAKAEAYLCRDCKKFILDAVYL